MSAPSNVTWMCLASGMATLPGAGATQGQAYPTPTLSRLRERGKGLPLA